MNRNETKRQINFSNPFEWFDGVFCVNLDKRTDRWAHATKQADQYGFADKLMRYSAIENKDNPSRGNHFSHANILEISKIEQFKNVLIFEDDCEFLLMPSEVKLYLSLAIEQLPEDWHMLYLGCNMDQYYAYQTNNNLAKLKGCFSTHAYAINHTLFNKLIDINRSPETVHNDVAYANLVHPNYNCYAVVPMLAGQLEGVSDIEKRRVSYNSMLLERFEGHLIRWQK